MQNNTIKKKLDLLPDSPGVYLFKNSSGRIIYVGKAKNLKKRVRSYFIKKEISPKTTALLEKLDDLDYIITSSEHEALILESNLIKKHRPRYNVILRDDKQYPYLKLTVNEEWPRLLVVRKIENDGASYFGPYSGGMVRDTIKFIKRIFPIRWCKETPLKMRKQPCMYFHIKKCDGPCIGAAKHEEYMKVCDEIASLLKGRLHEISEKLKIEMQEASKKLEFERAKALRDRARSLEKMSEGQIVISQDLVDRDVISFSKLSGKICAVVFQIRKGKLVGREIFYPTSPEGATDPEIITNIVIQYYTDAAFIPEEVILPINMEKEELFLKWLSEKTGSKVSIEVPSGGKKLELLKMAEDNSKMLIERKVLSEGEGVQAKAMTELKQKLELKTLPIRIEAFDISNISGTDTVGSMVVFVSGVPYKKHYRKFKIRTVSKPDDVAAIYEVVLRRYKGSLSKELALPDLILIDGGKGQVSSALKALKEAGLEKLSMIGLAKKFEEIYLPHQAGPLKLQRSSKGLQLLQRIRDEAHRFAVSFHRARRGKRFLNL